VPRHRRRGREVLTMRMTRLALLVAAPAILLAASGCGDNKTHINVMGHDLAVAEQNYGVQDPGYFCGNPANGQFEVILTDFSLCDKLHVDGGAKPAFHDTDSNNMRIVMPGPSYLKVPPFVNQFTVGADPNCSGTAGGQAVVYFSHNDPS